MEDRIEGARTDGEARGELLDGYRNYLEMLAAGWLDGELRAKAGPDDVVSETILEAHQQFAQFRGGSERELAGWLRQMLHRNLIDFARTFRETAARNIARERSIDDVFDRMAGVLICAEATPSTAAQNREVAVLLADVLKELPDEQRQVIVLRSLRDLSWDEAGDLLGRSADAARMLFQRAIRRLRPLIEARF